jgi:hypothetical protein
MLQIKDLKSNLNKLTEKKSEFKPLEIGFNVESRFDIFKRVVRKKYRFYIDEIKLSRFYTDAWMWNFVFLNLFSAFILIFIILHFNSQIPASIGLNLDNDRHYDFILNKEFLFILPFFHLIISSIVIFMSIKSQKKLSHLFVAAFFQISVLTVFELIAVKNFIVYFI